MLQLTHSMQLPVMLMVIRATLTLSRGHMHSASAASEEVDTLIYRQPMLT